MSVADAERFRGPGRAVLSGSWGRKKMKTGTIVIKYSLHGVLPDRYFENQRDKRNLGTHAAHVGADPNVYKCNQLLKLPGQSKRNDPRV